MDSERKKKLKEILKLEGSIYRIEFQDGSPGKHHPVIHEDVGIEDILLYIHDGLHDMCDKGDTIKITLKEDLNMDYSTARLVNAHKHLHESRYHWILDKKYLIKY